MDSETELERLEREADDRSQHEEEQWEAREGK
jgi:hypothetical protein